MKNSIVHFEIPVDNVPKAMNFYKKLFGWKITKYAMPGGDDYWIVQTTNVDKKTRKPTSPGINGGLMKRKNKGQPFMNYINVDSIDKMLQKIRKNGGRVCLPKMEIGKGMGWIAAFSDLDGNMMGLHEVPASMKKRKK